MLVRPSGLALRELLAVCWRRRRIRYFRDQVRSRCLSDTIDENSEQRDLEEDVESHTETEEKTFPITEPTSLLLLGEANACEVRLELRVQCQHSALIDQYIIRILNNTRILQQVGI